MFKKIVIWLVVIALVLAAYYFVIDGFENPYSKKYQTEKTSKGMLPTFMQLIGLVDLEELSNATHITIFAPTEEAYKKYGMEKIDFLKKPENEEELEEFLKYHMIRGEVTTNDFGDPTPVDSLQGEVIILEKKDDKYMVNDAQIIQSDMKFDVFEGNKGILHTVDKVLAPDINIQD